MEPLPIVIVLGLTVGAAVAAVYLWRARREPGRVGRVGPGPTGGRVPASADAKQRVFDELVQALRVQSQSDRRSPGVLLVAGAGISVPAVPAARALAEQAARRAYEVAMGRELGPGATVTPVKQWASRLGVPDIGDLPSVATSLWIDQVSFYDWLLSVYGPTHRLDTHCMIARLMRGGAIGLVATTNFDWYLEEALWEEFRHPCVVNTLEAKWVGGNPCLVKLHGDVLRRNWRLLQGDCDKPLPAAIALKLAEELQERPAIVLGYSGSDGGVMSVFHTVAARSGSTFSGGLWWVVYYPLTPEERKDYEQEQARARHAGVASPAPPYEDAHREFVAEQLARAPRLQPLLQDGAVRLLPWHDAGDLLDRLSTALTPGHAGLGVEAAPPAAREYLPRGCRGAMAHDSDWLSLTGVAEEGWLVREWHTAGLVPPPPEFEGFRSEAERTIQEKGQFDGNRYCLTDFRPTWRGHDERPLLDLYFGDSR
jgi:hypothetical protein